jgi:hypothetical protein
MKARRGLFLACFIVLTTAVLIVLGTVWPSKAAIALANVSPHLLPGADSPQASLERLLGQIGRRDWEAAYSSLGNKNEFGEPDFVGDLGGAHGGLRSYAMLTGYDIRPLHASAEEAEFRTTLQWTTVVGAFRDVRNLKVVRTDGGWQVNWPLVKEPPVPPQVIPVNYLRWDVIYSGPASRRSHEPGHDHHGRAVE